MRGISPATRFTSPRLRGEVGLRSNPGEGDSPRFSLVERAPHPSPLPASGARETATPALERTIMSRLAIALVIAGLAASAAAPALADEPISLRDMGSFHVGGRLVEISGKPVKEVTFTAGGVPAKVDPNGTYQVEQMYVQYFLP